MIHQKIQRRFTQEEESAISNTLSPHAIRWAEQLCKQQLPVLPHTGTRFIQELNVSDISLAKLARYVGNDPVLSLHLFAEAQKLATDSNGSITRLDHCLSMLGVTRVRTVANNIPVLKVARRSYCYRRYVSSIQQSQLAAHLTTSWSNNTSQRTDNPLYSPVLFYSCGAWILWRFEFEKITRLEELIFNQHLSFEEAELEIFGCSIQEISAAIVKRFGLPSTSGSALPIDWKTHLKTLAGINHRKIEDDKREIIPAHSGTNLLKNDAAKVCLANELAAQIQHRPYNHPHTKRIIKISAALLNRTVENHRKKTQQLVLSFSKTIRYPGIMPPAANMLFLPRTENPKENRNCYLGYLQHSDLSIKTTWQAENEKPALASNKNEKRKKTNALQANTTFTSVMPHLWKHLHDTSSKSKNLKQAAFYEFIPLLRQLPPAKTEEDIEEFLKICCIALSNYVGFPRIAFFRLLPENKLAYQCGAGFQKQEAFLKEPFAINPPQLISKLLKQPTGFWLKAGNSETVLPLLAKGILRISHDQGFVLMSIFYNDEPLGLFYCDRKGLNGVINEHQYKAFKQLCQICTQTFCP